MTDEEDFQKWWMAPGESFTDEEEIAREAWRASRKQSLLSAKFHPSASHITPDFRDHFNATLDQRIAEIEREEERRRRRNTMELGNE